MFVKLLFSFICLLFFFVKWQLLWDQRSKYTKFYKTNLNINITLRIYVKIIIDAITLKH